MKLKASSVARIGFLVFQGIILLCAFGFLFSGANFAKGQVAEQLAFQNKTLALEIPALGRYRCENSALPGIGVCIFKPGEIGPDECSADSFCTTTQDGDTNGGGDGGGPISNAKCVSDQNGSATCQYVAGANDSCTIGSPCSTGSFCYENQCFFSPLGSDNCTVGSSCFSNTTCRDLGDGSKMCVEEEGGHGNCVLGQACGAGVTGKVCAFQSGGYICSSSLSGTDNCELGRPCSGPTGAKCINGQCLAYSGGTDNCTIGQSCTSVPGDNPGRCSGSPLFCDSSPNATGAPCDSNNPCPSNQTPSCNALGQCVYNGGGSACSYSSPCPVPTPTPTTRCNYAGQCSPSGTGNPCSIPSDCWIETRCSANGMECIPGGPGDRCLTAASCLQPPGCNEFGACVPGGGSTRCTLGDNSSCRPQPKIPHCGPMICSDTITSGEVCSTYRDCLASAPGCNSQKQCVYGGTLGVCSNNFDCLQPLGCNLSTKQCIPGGQDGNCYTNADCYKPLGCDSATQKCIPGGNDGACSKNADCLPPPRCNEITQKCVIPGPGQTGGTGSICSKESDCQVARCTQQEPYQCVTYNQNGTGRTCSLDSADPDKICQPPPKKGKLIINKFTKGEDGSFQFFGNPLPLEGRITTQGSTPTKWGSGSTSFEVEPGTKENPIRYNIAEILPDHWTFVGADCDRSFILTTNSVEEVSVESEENTTCNFYNVKNGYIKIINKNLSWQNINQETAEYAIFQSPIYETITAVGQQGVGKEHEMVPGSYVIYQNTPINWNLANVTCSQSSQSSSQGAEVPTAVVNGAITVNVLPGTTVTCTFNNKLLEGNLIINKYADGGSDNFTFDIKSSGLNGGNSQTETISSSSAITPGVKNLKIAPGTYNIGEIVPEGWVLSRFNCQNTTYNSSENGPINVSIVDGKTTICNFYNTKKGYLKIVKEATGGDETFKYKIETYSQGQTGGPAITSEAEIKTVNGKGDSGLLIEDQGEYNILEEMPAGWKSNGIITCTGSGSFTQDVNGYGVRQVRVYNGQTTTCTFKNIKKEKPILKIKKETIGGDETFNFKIDHYSPGQAGGEAPLTANASVKTTNLRGSSADLPENVGEYNVTEDLSNLTDWTLTVASCVKENGSNTGVFDISKNSMTNVALIDGETTTCTFKNQKKSQPSGYGYIKIVKETDGQTGSSESFYFNIDVATFGLSSDSAKTKSTIVNTSLDPKNAGVGRGVSVPLEEEPGTYNIAEDISRLPKDWKLESAYCDRGSFTMTDTGVMNVQVVAGLTTTCTFKNSKTGILVIKKKTGNNGDGEFNFSVSPGINDVVRIKTKNGQGANDGNCADGSNVNNNKCNDGSLPNSPALKLTNNSYTITEKTAVGFALDSVVCLKQDQTPTGIFDSKKNNIYNVIVEAGKTTTCTFNNSKSTAGGGGNSGGFRGGFDNEPPLPGPSPIQR